MEPIVDLHSHFFPRAFVDLVRNRGGAHGASVDGREGTQWLTLPGHPPIPLGAQFVDLEARRAGLAAMGVTVQALSLSPPMVYWAAPALGVALAQAFNDGIAEICRSFPDSFVGLATLPLQDVALAVDEAGRAVDVLGMPGLYVGSSVRGVYLDDPRFWSLWEFAASRGVPVFTHPQNHLGPEVLARFHLANTIGFPMETAVMAARLIYAGIPERLPALRIVLAHGGGALPMLLGRLDHAHHRRPETREALSGPPSSYLKHFFFDSVTHSDRALHFLVDVVGAARVVLGSDAPYDMAEANPVGRVQTLGLDRRTTAAILGGNARGLLTAQVTLTAEAHGALTAESQVTVTAEEGSV